MVLQCSVHDLHRQPGLQYRASSSPSSALDSKPYVPNLSSTMNPSPRSRPSSSSSSSSSSSCCCRSHYRRNLGSETLIQGCPFEVLGKRRDGAVEGPLKGADLGIQGILDFHVLFQTGRKGQGCTDLSTSGFLFVPTYGLLGTLLLTCAPRPDVCRCLYPQMPVSLNVGTWTKNHHAIRQKVVGNDAP